MAADGDGLEVFDDWLEIFVADRAYCFGECTTSEHTYLLSCFPFSDSPLCASNQLSGFFFPGKLERALKKRKCPTETCEREEGGKGAKRVKILI